MFNIDFGGSYCGNGLNGFDCMVRHQQKLDSAIEYWRDSGYYDETSLFDIAAYLCGTLTKADKNYLIEQCEL